MRIVERKDLDEVQWKKWCDESSNFSPFSRLEYLDAVSENLVFAINDNNSGGLALPYIERLGVKTLYTPVFCRWITWVGEQQPSAKDLTFFINQQFKQAEVYTEDEIFTGEKVELIYQKVTKETFALNSQAKRKLKKAEKEGWKITWNRSANEAIDLIEASLKNKFETLEDSSFPKLRKLADNFNATGLMNVIAIENPAGEMLGALLLICEKNQRLYLKGACEESVKLAGGMYYLMNEAIQFTLDQGMEFDFGGSRISGVRKFNLSFGSEDQRYYHSSWNKGPFWYSLAKTIRKRIKK